MLEGTTEILWKITLTETRIETPVQNIANYRREHVIAWLCSTSITEIFTNQSQALKIYKTNAIGNQNKIISKLLSFFYIEIKNKGPMGDFCSISQYQSTYK